MSEAHYRKMRNQAATLQEDLTREEEAFEQQAQRVMRQMRMDFDARTADKREHFEDAQEDLAAFERRAKRSLRAGMRQIYASRDMDDDAKEQAAGELMRKFRAAMRPDDKLSRQQQQMMMRMMQQVAGGGAAGVRMIMN